MKIILLATLVLLVYDLKGQDVTPQELRPILIAVQVANIDRCIGFYSKYLGFQLQERKRYNEYHLEIAILKKDEFELELVKNDSSVNRNTVLKEKNAADITGFAKINFMIDEIEKFYNFVRSEKLNMVVSLRQSVRSKDHQTFIITDPEGNWLQFTGK